MNSKTKPQHLAEIEEDNTLSIDEFFKQLEAKEKDLDISSQLVIEFDEPDSEEQLIPDFMQADFPSAEIETVSQTVSAPEENTPTQIEVFNL